MTQLLPPQVLGWFFRWSKAEPGHRLKAAQSGHYIWPLIVQSDELSLHTQEHSVTCHSLQSRTLPKSPSSREPAGYHQLVMQRFIVRDLKAQQGSHPRPTAAPQGIRHFAPSRKTCRSTLLIHFAALKENCKCCYLLHWNIKKETQPELQ